MIETLFRKIALLGHWGYLMIFLAAFLESSAFLGLLVPGESIVVLSGFLASHGYLEIGDCIWVITLGAVLGDSVGYALGGKIGRGYFEKHTRLLFLKERHLRRADVFFQRRGGRTIFFGRFIGFLRAMAPFAAGMSRMPYRRFLVYNIAGGMLWAIAFTFLGYFFGESWRLIDKWSGRAGVFAFFILLIVVGFGHAYRTIAKKQEEIYRRFRDRYNTIISFPRVRSFIERHVGLVTFIRERLSPKGYMGLHLTIGLAASVLFVWIFAWITEDVLTGDPFVLVDQWVLHHVLYFKTHTVTRFMIMFTRLGGGTAITIGSFILTTYLIFIKRRFDYLITYIIAIIGGSIMVFVLKTAIHRVRPAAGISLVRIEGWSFPSAHSMMSVVFYGIIVHLLVRNMRSWRLQVFMATAAGFVVFLIGLSRIYLQVHYLSDVLAGFAGGLFWLSICITGLEVYIKKIGMRRRRSCSC